MATCANASGPEALATKVFTDAMAAATLAAWLVAPAVVSTAVSTAASKVTAPEVLAILLASASITREAAPVCAAAELSLAAKAEPATMMLAICTALRWLAMPSGVEAWAKVS